MRSMRRDYQEVTERATLERWLDEALVGRLATVDEDGFPVIKPVNFAYADGRVYFHSATEGEKLDDIRRSVQVGFEVDRLITISEPPERGCQTHAFYQSIIIRGRARILEDRAAKEAALGLLVRKYSPAVADTPLKGVENTAVVEVIVERMTGKEDFGQRWPVERKLAVARLLYQRDGAAAAEAIAHLGFSLEEVSTP
jgi:uncharacterized protein